MLPTSIVFDSSGNLYVAETNRHVVDRIDASGTVIVIAGDGSQGFSGDSGPATAAQLDSPQGLAVDAAGNLYIADTHNHRIRMVVAGSGTITTIAGNGIPGFSGDQAQAVFARLNSPTALALDNAGNLDIADSNNHRIRQLNLSSGIVATLAGNGIQADAGDTAAALSASIDTPTGLAVDSSNNLYLADTHNHRIRRVDHSTGIITTIAGGGTGSANAATSATLLLPHGLSFDAAGNLYLADTQAHRILRIAPDGTLTTAAGEGTQGYAGDNGPALAALLDSPRSPAMSPAGLLTLADTGNQRVRQLNANALIQTFSGAGPSTPAALTLTAPTTTPYGTGTLTASFASNIPATGAITFFETSNNLQSSLGTVPLSGNGATLSTVHLSAGSHQLFANYPGDASHSSLQSAVLSLIITPAPLSAAPDPASAIYGQPIPPLTGTISGVLSQDASLVSAVFSTTAKILSPAAASYPIAATLTGTSANNYTITPFTPAYLVISQAPTTVALSSSASTVVQGSPLTLSARAVSTTQGIPTGRATFLDNAAPIGSSPLDATGVATLAATLTAGSHSVTAAYSGDANFLSSNSSTLSTVVSTSPTPSPDFTLSPSGSASQTVNQGSSVAYTFSVTIVNGPLNSPIALTATGMPPGASASFSPSYIPPGAAATTFTLTIQTAQTTASTTAPRSTWPMIFCAMLVAAPIGLRRRRKACLQTTCFALAFFCLGFISGCGTTIATAPQAAAKSATYPLTVIATATSPSGATLQHAVSISLTVQ